MSPKINPDTKREAGTNMEHKVTEPDRPTGDHRGREHSPGSLWKRRHEAKDQNHHPQVSSSNQFRCFVGGPVLVKRDMNTGRKWASKHIASKKHQVSLKEGRCKHRMQSRFQRRPDGGIWSNTPPLAKSPRTVSTSCT